MLKFSKYHGTGNDFIIFLGDNVRDVQFSPTFVNSLCNRHFGIGADGLIIVEQADEVDFEMKYYNSDGQLATMCGNGARCAVAFAMKNNLLKGTNAKFLASDGFHEARLLKQSKHHFMVELSMNNTEEFSKKINDSYFVNTGSPHLVVLAENLDTVNVLYEGRKLRFSEELAPQGANINFVKLQKDGIYIRTYERGVEDETLSCGTGAVAAAIISAAISKNVQTTNLVKVFTKGGPLKISFELYEKKAKLVKLTGPAAFVFDGFIEYSFI